MIRALVSSWVTYNSTRLFSPVVVFLTSEVTKYDSMLLLELAIISDVTPTPTNLFELTKFTNPTDLVDIPVIVLMIEFLTTLISKSSVKISEGVNLIVFSTALDETNSSDPLNKLPFSRVKVSLASL